jgi:hypothetical protein
MILFEREETITNPVLTLESEFTEEQQSDDLYIASILKKEMHLSEDLVILNNHDCMIDIQYIYYIKKLINLLSDDGLYSLSYFLFEPENVLFLSITSSTNLYVIEVPDVVWKYYVPDDEDFH